MSAIELLPCPFCGGEAASVPDPNHSTGWDVGCFSGTCEIEPHVWAVHHTTAIDQWNRRTDLSQASVAAALEAAADACMNSYPDDDVYDLTVPAAKAACDTERATVACCQYDIRALITQPQHDALAAHVAAEVAKARVEDAEMLAESRAYALALQEELRVRTAKLERECRLTQAQVDRMLVNSTQMHTNLSGCKIALEQAWASNRERAAKITALTEAMTELRAMVVAECPSLLNEDSGGNGELSCQINDLLAGEMTMKTAAGKAADVLLEHIVYYDLVERRGAEIANAVIAELVEIGGNSDLTPTADKEPKA